MTEIQVKSSHKKLMEDKRIRAVKAFIKTCPEGRKLDLGGLTGQNPGFEAVNVVEPCDIRNDLDVFPYPFRDNSISAVMMASTLQHLKDPKLVMEEVWRICRPNARVFISVPYWKFHTILYNPGHYHDFKLEWFRNCTDSEMLIDKGMIKCGYRYITHWYLKGRVRFWKRYHLYVVLEVLK